MTLQLQKKTVHKIKGEDEEEEPSEWSVRSNFAIFVEQFARLLQFSATGHQVGTGKFCLRSHVSNVQFAVAH